VQSLLSLTERKAVCGGTGASTEGVLTQHDNVAFTLSPLPCALPAGVTKAALETLAGTEAVNADTTVTTTALQGTVDASRADWAIPDAVSVVADRTAAEGTYEWKSWRPRFTYQVGANYGLPVGLAVVTDTSGK
jgi:hypothetical protein